MQVIFCVDNKRTTNYVLGMKTFTLHRADVLRNYGTPSVVMQILQRDYDTVGFTDVGNDKYEFTAFNRSEFAAFNEEPKQERGTTMNYSTAVFLINDNARAMLCTYEAEENAPRTIFKTFDKTIQKDDYVVVPTNTRHKMTVVKVVEVDVDTWMDTSSPIEWIIGKVSVANFNELKAQEEAAIHEIKSAEKLQRRNELREKMFLHNAEKIKALPLAHQGEVLDVEAKKE